MLYCFFLHASTCLSLPPKRGRRFMWLLCRVKKKCSTRGCFPLFFTHPADPTFDMSTRRRGLDQRFLFLKSINCSVSEMSVCLVQCSLKHILRVLLSLHHPWLASLHRLLDLVHSRRVRWRELFKHRTKKRQQLQLRQRLMVQTKSPTCAERCPSCVQRTSPRQLERKISRIDGAPSIGMRSEWAGNTARPIAKDAIDEKSKSEFAVICNT